MIGIEGNLHKIPAWNFPELLELYARASFATGAENSNFRMFRPYHLQYFNRYTFEQTSFLEPSSNVPDIGGKVDWYTFNFGLGTRLWQRLGVDLYLSIYTQEHAVLDDNFGGVEFSTNMLLEL
jgi:hypothetical protein